MSDDKYRLGLAGAMGNGTTFCLMHGFDVLGAGFTETHNLVVLLGKFVTKLLHVSADSALFDAIMDAPSHPDAIYLIDEQDRLRRKISPCSDLQVAHMLWLSSFDVDALEGLADDCQKLVN